MNDSPTIWAVIVVATLVVTTVLAYSFGWVHDTSEVIPMLSMKGHL